MVQDCSILFFTKIRKIKGMDETANFVRLGVTMKFVGVLLEFSFEK